MAFKTSARAKPQEKNSPDAQSISRALLRWYDRHARELPWRVGPEARKQGVRADPYAVWLSEIMLQQTTVATVAPRYAAFLKRWPTVAAMAAAPVDDILGQWAGLGYYARARNLHKCAIEVAKRGGFPESESELRELPGIGAYTAAAIAAIAFDKRAVVVDGNVERIISRLFMIDIPLTAAKTLIKEYAETIWPSKRSGDFAQGLMDLGANVCRPNAPTCLLCPIAKHCAAQQAGVAEAYPVRPAKKSKPQRVGAVFALTNARGEMLFERRPDKGLLGGMLGLPGTAWTEELTREAKSAAPANATWEKLGAITHTFTHFHLLLDVYAATAPKGTRKNTDQRWIKPDEARVPTVMKKAVRLVCEAKQYDG